MTKGGLGSPFHALHSMLSIPQSERPRERRRVRTEDGGGTLSRLSILHDGKLLNLWGKEIASVKSSDRKL
jgi:hypothetical protein